MPLFRFQKGGLDKSLETTVIVKTFNDMIREIIGSFDEDMIAQQKWGAKFEIKPYPTENENFDSRTGWYTQMVLANLYEEDKMHPIGFLSEPFSIQDYDTKGIMLDEESFRCLVRGGVVYSGKIRIALSDIGYEAMLNAIDDATQGKDIYKDHHKDS